MPSVAATLAAYFGERPLEIRLYDADLERADLFAQFARTCFLLTKAGHEVDVFPEPAQALEGADRVILQVGTNCARKFLLSVGRRDLLAPDDPAPAAGLTREGYRPRSYDRRAVQEAVNLLAPMIPPDAQVLSLQRADIELEQGPTLTRAQWPGEISIDERISLPHQVLRWVHGEEYPHGLIQASEKSPVKAWLDAAPSLKG